MKNGKAVLNCPQLTKIVEDFLEYKKDEGYSEQTLRAYRYDIGNFSKWITANGVTVFSIDKNCIENWLDSQEKSGKSRSTIIRFMRTIRIFCDYLVDMNILFGNPTAKVHRRKSRRTYREIPSLNEIDKFLEVPDTTTPIGHRDRVLYEVLVHTGIYVGELVKLKLDDVNLLYGTIHIDGEHSRVLQMEGQLLSWLIEYVKCTRPQIINGRSTDILFSSRDAKPMSRNALQSNIKRHANAIGLGDKISASSIRHLFAIQKIDEGNCLDTMTKLLGNSSAQTTRAWLQRVGKMPYTRSVERKKESSCSYVYPKIEN